MAPKSTKKLFAASAVCSAAMLYSCNLVGVEETAPQDEVHQTPPAIQEIDQLQNRVRALLASESVKDQAWGAHYVGKYRLQAIAPELVPLLTRALKNKDWAVQRACIDGLIQTRQRVDNEVLKTLWENGSEYYALYLAAHDTAQAAPFLIGKLAEGIVWFDETNNQDASRDTVTESKKTLFITICNMLIDGEKKKFVETVIPHIKPVLHAHIELPPDDQDRLTGSITGGGTRSAMTIATGTSRRDTTMPPSVSYSLTLSPREADVMFARGPQSVYLRREINKNGSHTNHGGSFDNEDYLRDCLVWIVYPSDLQRRGYTMPKIYGYAELYWTSKEEFLGKIEIAATNFRAPWIELFEQLKQREALPKDMAAEALFPVKITYSGHKETVKIPLPSLFKGGKFSEQYLSP